MAIRIVVDGVKEAGVALDKIAQFNALEFLDGLGGLITRQTQRRIRSEKTSPDGDAWKPNLEGTSILYKSGQLDDSIHHEVSNPNVEIGSNKIYAGVHQTGAVIKPKNGNALSFGFGGNKWAVVKSVTIPARPYLGFSSENRKDIEQFATDFLVGDFEGVAQ